MTATALIAAVAGALGAVAVAELGALASGRMRRARPDGDGGGGLAAGLRRLAGRADLPPAPDDLVARLAAAGAPPGVAPREVMALKCALAVVALGAGTMVPGRLHVAALVAAPALGFVIPDGLLVRRARRRARRLQAEAPDVLERLRLAAEAGLPPGRAVAEAAGTGTGDLAAELRSLCARTELGEPRDAALERLRRRCPIPEVTGLAAAIRRAERQGSPLGGPLAALATQARAERTRRIHVRAQQAAPQIQLVVALLLVPAALLLIAAGLLTSFSSS